MMKAALVSILLFVASATARRGSGGGGGSGGIDDNWDAPWQTKATMAFYIIWFIISLAQFFLIIKYLRLIPTMTARAPYIMLLIATGFITIAQLIWAIFIRVSTGWVVTTSDTVIDNLISTINFFLSFDYSFHVGAILYLAHQRADLLRRSQGKGVAPLASMFWKRCLDWALVAILTLLMITYMAVNTHEAILGNQGRLTSKVYRTYIDVLSGFSHTQAAFAVLLAIDTVVTLVTLLVAEKRWKFQDPIPVRLLAVATPFVVLFAIEWLAVEIYIYTAADRGVVINYLDLNFAQAVMEGVFRVGMTAGVIITMTIPNVNWTPPSYAAPEGQPYHPTQQYQPYQPYAPSNYPPSYHTGPAGWSNTPSVPSPPPNQSEQPAQPHTIPMNVAHA